MNDDYEDVGYIWFSYHTDNVWEGHVAISPDYQKRWVNKQTIDAIKTMIEWSGIEHLIVSHPDPKITKQLGRFGFTVTHPVCILNIGEDNGLWRRRTNTSTPSGTLGHEQEEVGHRPKQGRSDGGSCAASCGDLEKDRP
jgi:hypothetical protein